MVNRGTKVKIKAPFMDIDGEDDKPVPILMDRHFMNDMIDYINKKKLKMIHCDIKDHHIILKFSNKLEATKFALGYTEIHAKTKPEIF